MIHVGAILGLVLTPLPGWPIFLAAAGLHFLGGLGTTVCYHRAITHKSLKLHPVVRNVLTFFAMMNGSGSPLSWAANHRLHHAKSDTPEDISSPRVGGFWWSHLRWLWQAGPAPVSKYCRDIDKPAYRVWDAHPDSAGRDRVLRRPAVRPGGVLLDRADPADARAARAVLRQQHLPHAPGRRPRRSDRKERPLAVAAALLPGRELAPEPPRPSRLGAPRLDAAAARHRLVHDPAAGEARPRHQRAPARRRSSRARSTSRPEAGGLPGARRCPAPLATDFVQRERDRRRQVERAQLAIEHRDRDGVRRVAARESGRRGPRSRGRRSARPASRRRRPGSGAGRAP